MPLTGKRVFVVEDEPLLVMAIEDMLQDIGCEAVIAPAGLREAASAAGLVQADVALLDVNIAGQRIDPVADVLAKRGIPMVFATGYEDRGLPDRHAARLRLGKPFGIEDLRSVLLRAIAGQ